MNRNILSVVVILGLLAGASLSYASTTLMQIGRSPFYQPPLTTVESFLTMVQEKAADVKKGFEKSGQPELFEPFMAQVGAAQIEMIEFQHGSTFEWMMFKKKGKGAVRVAKDVTWGNENPFSGFRFDIDHGGNRYAFAVPLGCGNIALVAMSKIPAVVVVPVAVPVVAPPVNQAPQCGVTVSSVKAFCGEIITIDASNSVDSDGDIAHMTITFVDDQGQVVSENVIDGNLVSEVAMPCGSNTLKVTVTDNEGKSATSEECTVALTGTSRARFIADLGFYRQYDPANYLFGRVGFEYKFNEDWAVLGLIGAAPHVDGIDGVSAFLADVMAEYSFSRYFVDFGVGGWITDGDDDLPTENSQLDLIAAIGARVYGEPEDFNASVFFEVRSAVDELDGLYDYGRFGLGVRFRF